MIIDKKPRFFKKLIFWPLVIGAIFYLSLFLIYHLSPHDSFVKDRLPRLQRRIVTELLWGKFIAPLVNIIEVDQTPPGDNLRKFEIRIKKSDWNELDRNRRKGIRDNYYSANFFHKDKVYPVKVRYRGDMPGHFLNPKKSWRIKMPKGSNFEDSRLLNFVNPQDKLFFNDFLAFNIGRSMGLLTPQLEYVSLYINKKYHGVYALIEQVDRYFQIRNWRMEGSLYSLDTFSKTDADASWDGTKPWDKTYTSGRETKEDQEILPRLLALVRDPNSTLKEIGKLLNLDSAAKFKALTLLLQSLHIDKSHNHKLYHDPTDGKLHYVVWDVGEIEEELDPYFLSNPLDGKLFQFPEYLEMVQKNIIKTITEYYPLHKLKQDLQIAYEDVAPYIDKELYKVYDFRSFRNPELLTKKKKIIELMTRRYSTYEKELLDMSKVQLTNKKIISTATFPITIISKNKSNKHIVTYYPSYQIIPKDMKNFPSAWRVESKEIAFKKTFIDIPKNENQIYGLLGEKLHVVTNNNLPQTSAYKAYSKSTTVKKIILEDIVQIYQNKIFDKNTDVIIMPGTKIFIKSNSSIIFYGSVRLLGEKKNPVQIRSLIPNQKWGTFAIQSSLNSNLIKNAIFSGGGDARVDGVFYPGMLSSFNSTLRVENSFFTASFGDDAVNIKKGEAFLENNIFYKTGFDALDMDFTKGIVKNNLFLHSGNDGIDCGTATPDIRSNFILGSGDKGISLGEHSNTKISNNWIIKNSFGIAVKDSSKPIISRNYFSNNKIALASYRKKLMYDGGSISAKENCFNNNEIDFEEDIFSSIRLSGECVKNSEPKAIIKEVLAKSSYPQIFRNQLNELY